MIQHENIMSELLVIKVAENLLDGW